MATTGADVHYSVVGQNNRNLLVQSKKVAPYHEDITRITPFEKDNIAPGSWASINLDFKHAMDREIILNDIRLRFKLDLSARSAAAPVGRVYAVRATDLIQQMVVKINNDTVFEVTKSKDLSFLWEMNNHRTLGQPLRGQSSYMLNHGVIPAGHPPVFEYDDTTKGWYTRRQQLAVDTNTYNDDTVNLATPKIAVPGEERHDGIPRLIFDDGENPDYIFNFDVSLNQLVGPIFHRLHIRRVEHVQIDLMFEPYVTPEGTQEFLLFAKDPTVGGTRTHPYQLARYTNLEIRQYRTVLLDGINGFTLPPTKMLSWLMHRYSRREYAFDMNTMTYIDIPLKDWEIRTNITRVLWMWAPDHWMDRLAPGVAHNYFYPMGAPNDYDALAGVEILWKNDKVLDLDTTYEVFRHYILSENKRYGFDDPFIRFSRLTTSTVSKRANAQVAPAIGGTPSYVLNEKLIQDGEVDGYIWQDGRGYRQAADGSIETDPRIGCKRYEFPIYHVDLNMNIQHGVPGAEIIGGIVNDTNDYVIRIKKLSDRPFDKTYGANRTLWVFLEYQTLVNLSANSNHFNRGSQIITKQLNPQS